MGIINLGDGSVYYEFSISCVSRMVASVVILAVDSKGERDPSLEKAAA